MERGWVLALLWLMTASLRALTPTHTSGMSATVTPNPSSSPTVTVTLTPCGVGCHSPGALDTSIWDSCQMPPSQPVGATALHMGGVGESYSTGARAYSHLESPGLIQVTFDGGPRDLSVCQSMQVDYYANFYYPVMSNYNSLARLNGVLLSTYDPASSGTAIIPRGTSDWSALTGFSYTLDYQWMNSGGVFFGIDQVVFHCDCSNPPPTATPTATLTPLPVDCSYLGSGPGTGFGSTGSCGEQVWASPFTLAQPQTIQSIGTVLEVGEGNINLAVYGDNGNAPGALIVEGFPVKPLIDELTLIPVSPTLLAPGTYWLAIKFDDCVIVPCDSSQPGVRNLTDDAWGDGSFPAAYPDAAGDNNDNSYYKFSLRAFYCPTGAVLSPTPSASASPTMTASPTFTVTLSPTITPTPYTGACAAFVYDREIADTGYLAISTAGDIYVSGSPSMKRYDATGAFVQAWASTSAFNSVRGMAVGASNIFFVPELLWGVGNCKVNRLAADGTWMDSFGTTGMGPGQFLEPSGVAVGPDGRVYVSDRQNQRVSIFSQTGSYLGSLGYGAGAGGLGTSPYPQAVAVGADGYVYVADASYNRIDRFSPAGAYLSTWGGTGAGPGQFSSPRYLAVLPSGEVVVVDQGNNRLQRFTATGGFIDQWGGLGSGPGQFNTPSSIAAAPDGSIWVGDSGNSRTQRFVCSATIPSPTVTRTFSLTPTVTTTPSRTVTQSFTLTATPTYTATPSATPSWTATPSASPSATLTLSISPSSTNTPGPGPSATPSLTQTPTPTSAASLTPCGACGATATEVPAAGVSAVPAPNPATGSSADFIVSGPAYSLITLKLYNTLGDLLTMVNFTASGSSQRLTVDISGYASGVYYYQLYDNTGRSLLPAMQSFAVLR